MTVEQKSVPTWILVVSGIFAFMELGVAVSMCVAPESMSDTIDINAKGVDYLVYMWAVRQFALGFIFAFATFKKSVPMLTIAYVFFFVMFAGDLLVGISRGEMSFIIPPIVMCVISSAIIFAINKKK